MSYAERMKRFGGPPPIGVGAIQGEHGDQVDVWTYVDVAETSPVRITIHQDEENREAEAWLSVQQVKDLMTLLLAACRRAGRHA